VDEGGRFRCTIYDVRPDVCRALAQGSPECAGEIAAKGDRPALVSIPGPVS
jgi:hypothetical protein